MVYGALTLSVIFVRSDSLDVQLPICIVFRHLFMLAILAFVYIVLHFLFTIRACLIGARHRLRSRISHGCTAAAAVSDTRSAHLTGCTNVVVSKYTPPSFRGPD